MRNNRSLLVHPAAVFLLLTLLTAFLSWVGSVYGWEGVQSLLSPEGIRWRLRTVQEDFCSAPCMGPVLLLCLGVGVCLHSGWWPMVSALVRGRRQPTRKERRALKVSAAVGMAYAVSLLFLAFGPWSGMRNISGTLAHSPLHEGWAFLLSFGGGCMAVVYAYVADYYNSGRDIVRGMAYGFVRCSTCLVTLFFVTLFFSSLRYTGLPTCWGVGEEGWQVGYAVAVLWALCAPSDAKDYRRE